MVQYAIFLLVIGHTPFTLLTLRPRVATFAQALVGLHANSSVAAGWFTFSYSHEEKKGEKKAVKSRKIVQVGLGLFARKLW